MSLLRRFFATCGLALGLGLLLPAAPAAAAGACGSARYEGNPDDFFGNSSTSPHACAQPATAIVPFMTVFGVIGLVVLTCGCGWAAGLPPGLMVVQAPTGAWVVAKPPRIPPPPRSGPKRPRGGTPRQEPKDTPEAGEPNLDEGPKFLPPIVQGAQALQAGTKVPSPPPWWMQPAFTPTGPVKDPVTAALMAAIFAGQAGQRIGQVIMRTPQIVDIIRTVPWPLLP